LRSLQALALNLKRNPKREVLAIRAHRRSRQVHQHPLVSPPSVTTSISPSWTPSSTRSASQTVSATRSASATRSQVRTPSGTRTPSRTSTQSRSQTKSQSHTTSETSSGSAIYQPIRNRNSEWLQHAVLVCDVVTVCKSIGYAKYKCYFIADAIAIPNFKH